MLIQSTDEESPKMPEAVIYIQPGVYVKVGPSATGMGSHVRWVYEGFPALGSQKDANPGQEIPATHDPLYRSVFGGSQSSLSSLSSLSSWSSFNSSSDSSFSVVDTSDSSSDRLASESSATSFELISPTSSLRGGAPQSPPQTPTRSRRQRVPFATAKECLIANPPRTPIKSKRPLVRSPGHRWTHDSFGNSIHMGITNALPKAVALPTRLQQGGIDFNRIFSSEFQKLKNQREQVMAAFKNCDEEDLDMVNDAVQMLGASRISTSNGGKPIGPNGTQLIDDDDFNLAPVSIGIYRQEWIDRKSTALRPIPTDPLSPE